MINIYEDLGPFIRMTVGVDNVTIELLFNGGNTITYDYYQYATVDSMKNSMVYDLFYFMGVAGVDDSRKRKLIHEELLNNIRERKAFLIQSLFKYHNRA